MKTIVDTCVWSLALRRKNKARVSSVEDQRMLAQLREAIQDRRAAIVGPIRQEILSGIRDKTQFSRTQELLDPFRDEEIAAGDYIEAARFFILCRDKGVECGPVDILICAVAARMRYDVLTSDKGLKRCLQILRNG
jgi:predicted nucleic acid-binding protein